MAMEVVIVGGGLVGASLALSLADAGAHVTVLERSSPGAEASSAAAGILGAQVEAHGPDAFLALCLESRRLYPEFVARVERASGVKVGYRACGVLHAAESPEETRALERTVAWQRELGLRAELLGPSALAALEPALSPAFQAAAYFPDDAQVDNRKLTRATVLASERAGARWSLCEVEGLLDNQARVTGVSTRTGPIRADAVILAAGAWSTRVKGTALAASAVQPALGQIALLRSRDPLLTRVVFADGGYLVPREGRRVLVGSTLELGVEERQVTAEGVSVLLLRGQRVCPALRGATVEELWAGVRPYTPDRLPILGAGHSAGLFYATGHFRNGILLAPVTASVLTDVVMGRQPSVPLDAFRFDRPALG